MAFLYQRSSIIRINAFKRESGNGCSQNGSAIPFKALLAVIGPLTEIDWHVPDQNSGGSQAFRRIAIRPARLLGLSRPNDRASPSSSRTYFSVAATAASRALSLKPNDDQTIFSVSTSYSQRPINMPRSKIA